MRSFALSLRRPAALLLVSCPALALASVYPEWKPDVFYAAGTVVSYAGRAYKAVVDQIDHTGTGWNPTVAALWTDLGPDGSAPPPPPPTTPPPTPAPDGSCKPAWSSTAVYLGGAQVSHASVNYSANWWTSGQNPATSSGPVGSGQPWTATGSCGGTTPPTPPTPPTPTGFVFGPYKDTSINLNWVTNVISTSVTGTRTPLLDVLPARVTTVTWAFATGACGSETWGGVSASAMAAANVPAFVRAGKKYILSTGGAAGAFTCTSDSGFQTFLRTYESEALIGVDFDIEAGQSQADIDHLVARVKAAQPRYPHLRWSFTIATLGGRVSPSLGPTGIRVMNAIRSAGLTRYFINLMAMDYGSPTGGSCTLGASGQCDMGASAVQAAMSLHEQYGVPYDQIEVTPMIGGNDTPDETFTRADVQTLARFSRAQGLAGIHYWSLDRDTDCPPGSASPTCNTYGTAGTLGFTSAFLNDLGL